LSQLLSKVTVTSSGF